MTRKSYYSPALRRDLISRLYFAAKDCRVPMTVLADRLMEDALNRIVAKQPTPSIGSLSQAVPEHPVAKLAA